MVMRQMRWLQSMCDGVPEIVMLWLMLQVRWLPMYGVLGIGLPLMMPQGYASLCVSPLGEVGNIQLLWILCVKGLLQVVYMSICSLIHTW